MPFSPQLVLSTYVKFTPFATRSRRGYIRDAQERDLGVHLESALRGVIIGDRWPKSGVEVIVTVLEAEEDSWWGDSLSADTRRPGVSGCGLMTVLAGCITVASAAIAEAGIDCVDLVSGGVAALVKGKEDPHGTVTQLILDPCPSEHSEITAACVVGYLSSRDEITEIWTKGDSGNDPESLMDGAVEAAKASRAVLDAAVKESVEKRLPGYEETEVGKAVPKVKSSRRAEDVEMT